MTNAVYFQVKTKVSGEAWNGRFGFAEYSTRTGKLLRILGYWTVKPAGYWPTPVLWSEPVGAGAHRGHPRRPDRGHQGERVHPAEHAARVGAILDIWLGAQAGAW